MSLVADVYGFVIQANRRWKYPAEERRSLAESLGELALMRHRDGHKVVLRQCDFCTVSCEVILNGEAALLCGKRRA